MTYHKTPPAHDAPHPENLLSPAGLELLKEHYNIVSPALRGVTEWPEKRLNQKYTPGERAGIASLQEMLRDAGYWIGGINQDGRIRWLQQRKSEVQMLVEKTFPDLPEKPNRQQILKMQDYCRGMFRDLLEELPAETDHMDQEANINEWHAHQQA